MTTINCKASTIGSGEKLVKSKGKSMNKALRIYYNRAYRWVNSESKSLDSDRSKFRSTFLFDFFLFFLLEASESVSCTSADTILTLFFLDSVVAGFGVLGSEFAGEAWGLGVCGREGRLSDWFL